MPHTFRRVEQIHDTGCFISTVAMLLHITYEEAFKLVHPDKSMDDHDVGIHTFVMEEADKAQEYLHKFGIKVTPSKERYLRRVRRDAILIIRWKLAPTLLHAIIYLAKEQRFLDSAYRTPLRLKSYQRQLDSVLLIDEVNHVPR